MPSDYYLIESEGYYYCTKKRDLLTSSDVEVKLQASVPFKYGSQTGKGTIIFKSSSESAVLTEMKRLKKERKVLREVSFHADQPRKAALVQRQLMQNLNPRSQKSSTSSQDKKKANASAAREKKKKRDQAKNATEDSLQKNKASNIDGDEDSGESFSESVSSEEKSLSTLARNKANLKDAIAVKKLNGDSSDSDEVDTRTNLSKVDSGADGHTKKPSIVCIDEETSKSSRNCDDEEKVSTDIIDLSHESKSDKGGSKKRNSQDSKDEGIVPKKSKLDGSGKVNESTGNETKTMSEGGDQEDASVSDQDAQTKTSENGHVLSSGDEAGNKGQRSSKESEERKQKHTGGKEKESKQKQEESPNESDCDIVKSKKKKKKKDKRKMKFSEESQEESDDSSAKSKRKKRKKSRRRKVKKGGRNETVYDGVNYLYSADSPGVMKLNERYNVYVLRTDQEAMSRAKSCKSYVSKMVDKIYTKDALRSATPRGFPPRGKGRDSYKKKKVLPMLHQDGIAALIATALELQETNRMWRPKITDEGPLKTAISVRCSSFRVSSSSSSSSSSSAESSSED